MRWIVVMGLLVACGEDEGEASIDDGPLSGTIAGADWSVQGARTDEFLSDEEDAFTILHGDDLDCDIRDSSGNHVIVSLPMEVGETELAFGGLTVTLYDYDGGVNNIAAEGLVRIDSVSDTEITGGLVAIYDDDNQVSGTFTVPICSE